MMDVPENQITEIAKQIIKLAFNNVIDPNVNDLDSVACMIRSNIHKLRKINRDNPKYVEFVNDPENGGWIRAFYLFNKKHPENKDDIQFVYKFNDRNVKIVAKREDINNWANKWDEFSKNNKLSKFKLLMGEDNWNGRMIDRDRYTTNSVRLKLFGKDCKFNGNPHIRGCYGKVMMHRILFTATENNSGMCKTCEARVNKNKQEHKEENNNSIIKINNSISDQVVTGFSHGNDAYDIGECIAKRVALKVLESDVD
jgi:hypothetical protein